MSIYEAIIALVAVVSLVFKIYSYIKDRKNNRP